jgi:GT2 family glycosyltransferase
VKILPGAIDALELYLKEHVDVALVAPRLLFPDGRLQPSIRAFPTAKSVALYLSYLDRIFSTGYRKTPKEHQHSHEIDQPMGAAMMVRTSVIKEIGGFDPRFFLYMEEVDLCYRIKQKGYKIVYLPEARMIHHAGGSSRQDWERAQTHFLNSVRLYFEKHNPQQARKLQKWLPPALLARALVLLCLGKFREAWFWLRNVL